MLRKYVQYRLQNNNKQISFKLNVILNQKYNNDFNWKKFATVALHDGFKMFKLLPIFV